MPPALPIIFAIVASAAIIVGVLLWRLRPQDAGEANALRQRLEEEKHTSQTLQEQVRAKDAQLQSAAAQAAAASATAQAAAQRTTEAETRFARLQTERAELQSRFNTLAPQAERAQAEQQSAEQARAVQERRVHELAEKNEGLAAAHQKALERAASAEANLAGLQRAVPQREEQLRLAEAEQCRLQERVDALSPQVEKAQAERQAAEAARADLARRLEETTARWQGLNTDHRTAVERAATAEAETANMRENLTAMSRTLEAYQIDLTQTRQELAAAQTKQQSDEAAGRQFKQLSQEVLKTALEEARQELGALAEGMHKSGRAELEHHAEKVAKTLEPLDTQLRQYNEAVESLKKNNQENYGGLKEQINELQKTERTLQEQATALTTALSASPKVRGNYGELMLKQLVEFVGMRPHCHFEEQASRETEEGRRIPDMVIALPGGQKVVVDAKAVMEACVEAHRCQDDLERGRLFKKHSDHVRSRVVDLSSKSYFTAHADAVEAVVLFLPAEHLYAAAVETDPELTEYALRKNIIVCGPNALLMLLKVATQLWRRASIEQEAKQIAKHADDIYKSACDFVEKFAKIGTKIRQLEGEYNAAAGTLDARLIPAGRKIVHFVSAGKGGEMDELPHLKEDLREFRSEEAKRALATVTQEVLVLSEEKGSEAG